MKLLDCRRSKIALTAIAALTYLGYSKGLDVSSAIALVAVGVAGANAYQKKGVLTPESLTKGESDEI